METEGPHEHGHMKHGTGFRWFDICLAVSALCVSLSSLWLTMHNARTMEKLVAANSYPNVDIQYGNEANLDDGLGQRRIVNVALENTGIGPARLRSIVMTFGGKPVASLRALLEICCTQEPPGALPKTNYYFPGDLRGAMLPVGKSVYLFAWPENAADPRWARLESVRRQIGVAVCYCSVFDECYLRDSNRTEPQRVASCPVPPVRYGGD